MVEGQQDRISSLSQSSPGTLFKKSVENGWYKLDTMIKK